MANIYLTRIPFHRFIARSVPTVTCRPMSFKAAVLKLKSPIRDLVLSVTRDGHEFLGENEADANDVLEWIDKMSREGFLTESELKVCLYMISLCIISIDYDFQDLDTLLVPKTYIATNYLTAADVAFYGSLYSVFVSTYCLEQFNKNLYN
jgi:aminoacyl tRNA synthase complex-interacting multifunctional protein 1